MHGSPWCHGLMVRADHRLSKAVGLGETCLDLTELRPHLDRLGVVMIGDEGREEWVCGPLLDDGEEEGGCQCQLSSSLVPVT
jgi:hypothetical protein